MPADREVLAWYREKARVVIGRVNDMLENARWEHKRALAEEELFGKLEPEDVEVARSLGLLVAKKTSGEWQEEINRLQGQKEALQRFMGKADEPVQQQQQVRR